MGRLNEASSWFLRREDEYRIGILIEGGRLFNGYSSAHSALSRSESESATLAENTTATTCPAFQARLFPLHAIAGSHVDGYPRERRGKSGETA